MKAMSEHKLSSQYPALDSFIQECAQLRHNAATREEYLDWYYGVAEHLLASRLPEPNVIDLLRKHPIQVEFIKKYCNSLTPEGLAKRLLKKPAMSKEYDEYALPKVRVTRKMIAAFRKELEQEYRKKLGSDDRPLAEEFIQYRSYGVSNDYIADCLRSRQSAADVVYWETY